jgi:hypothetical protein
MVSQTTNVERTGYVDSDDHTRLPLCHRDVALECGIRCRGARVPGFDVELITSSP